MALTTVSSERLSTNVKTSNLGTELKGKIGQNKNLIINGAMNVAQRGTPTASGSYTTAAYGACDRWKLEANSTDQAAFVISQESDAPTGSGFSKSIKIKTNTAETSLDSNEILHLSQPIEAQDLQHLKNGTSSALSITLSFWVKSYQTGTYVVTVYKPDNTQRIISATYTISASNTWEFKTMTFPGDTSGSGIANDTGIGFQIYWILAAGSDFTGTTNTSWANYSNGGFANGQAVNIMSSTDNYLYLTGVQLEVGSVATDFEHRSFGQELALCQRYFFSVTGDNADYPGCYTGGMARGGHFFWMVHFPVAMRTNPTYTGVSGNGQGYGDGDSSVFANSTAIVEGSSTTPNPRGQGMRKTSAGGSLANGNGYMYRFSGDGNVIHFDAEL